MDLILKSKIVGMNIYPNIEESKFYNQNDLHKNTNDNMPTSIYVYLFDFNIYGSMQHIPIV